MRVNDTDFIDLDITDALSSILGMDVTKMNAPETYAASTSDEVTQTQFLQALNDTFAARSEFTGDNAVTASINRYGMLKLMLGVIILCPCVKAQMGQLLVRLYQLLSMTLMGLSPTNCHSR